jgi:hypothetical protein
MSTPRTPLAPDAARDRSRRRPPFDHALVAVCGECSGRDPRPKALRKHIRRALRAAGPKRAVRVVEVSCLDLCPKRAVAVLVARVGDGGVTCHVVGARTDAERLTGDLVAEQLRSSSLTGPAAGATADHG